MEELNSFTYLDWVVREALRLFPPLPYIFRSANGDTELPISKPFVDTAGREVNSIRIRKGETLYLSVVAMNKRKDIFGDDAEEFRCGRP